MLDENVPSAEEIAGHYSAALDSVNLINKLVAEESLDNEDKETIDRNVRHLEIIVSKSFWTNEDLTPFTESISSGKSKIA